MELVMPKGPIETVASNVYVSDDDLDLTTFGSEGDKYFFDQGSLPTMSVITEVSKILHQVGVVRVLHNNYDFRKLLNLWTKSASHESQSVLT